MSIHAVASAYTGETDYGSLVFISNGHVIEVDPPTDDHAYWFVIPDTEKAWSFRSIASAFDYVARCLAA